MSPPSDAPGVIVNSPSLSRAPAPNMQEPAEDYSTFLYVLQTGGCAITQPAALAWLDRYTQENKTMPEEHVTKLLEMMRDGRNPKWESGYRQHIFNSTFNALHLCAVGEPFTRILQDLTLHDADPVIRLYAMQHLGMQRSIGHLTGELADEIHSLMETLAKKSGEEVSGTAIQVLASWDGADNAENDPSTRQIALATASDSNRPVDIRVTAIHAAGSSVLPLARDLARNPSESVMLRKAAISQIGQHGDMQDVITLNTLAGESSRLAQAAEPALAEIRKRLSGKITAEPIPY